MIRMVAPAKTAEEPYVRHVQRARCLSPNDRDRRRRHTAICRAPAMSERNKHKKPINPCSSLSSEVSDDNRKQPPQTRTLASLLPQHLVPVHFRLHRPVLHLIIPGSLLLLCFCLLRPFISSYSMSSAATSSPSTIYVYDLPRKFTYGVIESYLLARDPSKTAIRDSDLPKYPGHQHSAEWWLFADINRPNRDGSPIVRIDDPEKADLFYVPFFSSLSLVVNPIRPAAGTEGVSPYGDEAMQEEMMAWLEEQEYWKRNGGRDHVFVCQDPNALVKVVDRIKESVLLVSDFGRLRGDQSSLVKDVILPYSHRINTFKGEVGVANRKSLLFFMGNRYRKEGGKIRDMLFQILEGEDDVIIKHGAQSRESRRVARHGMHSSKFCLHPAGDTPSACRLFDAIVSLCIPVVVSDDIELPFEDVVDYRKIAIFVDAQRAVTRGYLLKLLREVATETILQYQNEIKAVKHYFEYDDPNGVAVNEIWRQVSLKVPLIKLMNNRDKRLLQRKSDGLDCSCICSRQNGTVHFST